MNKSTMPTGFPENAEQSLSPELSDELTMALAAGRWWAIMEVSRPISEEPEYWELTSGLWWGTVKARETSCPTSRVFNYASEKAQYSHSNFSDATTKTTKKWRQKKTLEAPMPARSTHVHASSKKGNLASPVIFNEASVAAESPHEAPVIVGSPQEAPVIVGSPQEAPVIVGSPQGETVPKSLQRAPGPAPKVPTGSPHGAPMPDKVPDRQNLNIPEPLRQELLQQQKPQSQSLQGTLPDNISKRQRLKIPEPLRSELLQQKPQAYSVQGASMPDKTSKKKKIKIPEPLRQDELQQKPQASLQVTLPDNISKRQRLKISEPLRSELLQQKPQSHSLQGTLPDNISKRQRLKIPEPLRSELLQQKPQAYPLQGAPVPDKSSKREKLKIPEPLRKEQLQQKPQASLQVTLPDNIPKRQRLKIPEPLRSELLQQKPQASLQGTLPVNISKSQEVNIPEPMKQEMLQQKPASCAQGANVSDKIPEKRNLKILELLGKDLLQQKPQAKSPQDTPLPDRTPVGVSVHASTPQATAVPAGSPKGADMPSRILKGSFVHSGKSQGALVPAGSPKQKEKKTGEIIRDPKQQKQREQQRQPIIPKEASSSEQEAQENRGMAAMAPQDAPVPVNMSPFIQGTPQGAAVPGRTIKQGKCWIPHHLRQQKPSRFAQSLPGPPMPSQCKRPCPWSTKASEGVCQPPPQNKICVKIDKKVQLDLKLMKKNQISTSHLDQSSLQPRSQLNRKRALDSAGVDQSPPQKIQRLAIKVRDQQMEPSSLKQNRYLCSMLIHFCKVLNI